MHQCVCMVITKVNELQTFVITLSASHMQDFHIVHLHYLPTSLVHMDNPKNVNLVCGILHTKHMHNVYIGRGNHYNPLEHQNQIILPAHCCNVRVCNSLVPRLSAAVCMERLSAEE